MQISTTVARSINIVALFILTIAVAGCTRPGDHPISPDCSWQEDDHRTLRLDSIAERRHLHADAATAEDVAIRWADKYFSLRPEYASRRDECTASLFKGIAENHRVEVALVRQYSRERDVLLDSATILSFGLLYITALYYLIGKLRRKFGEDESNNFWAVTIVLSVGGGLVGMLTGSLWSIVIENYRLNSAHLSYRMNRLPFRQHWFVCLLFSILIFWLVAFIRSRSVGRDLTKSTDYPDLKSELSA
jgi:hypothetical protein